MSADQLTPAPAPSGPRVPKLSREDSDALTWLGKWIGIPFIVVIAIFYSEYIWGGSNVNIVPTVTRQEVKPYPFPDGAAGPTLAPPEIPRVAPPPPPLVFEAPPPPPTPSQIVARPLSQPKPVYPRRALEAEREGVVRLRITIQPDGSVSDAVVSSAHPPGWFENAAIDAVKRWRFQPGSHIIVTPVEIEFKLN
ncbi:MAG: energy transducer TonB [Alphaproteobacteria bacterium]|nr:energy transducer TonB [Alphaproteobacteria bacterium]